MSATATPTVAAQAAQGAEATQGGGAGAQTDDEMAFAAESMELSPAEHTFLGELAPFVGGTPRRGLRFVNLYRLVKTGLPEDMQKDLQDDSNHLSYRALITQLAIVTGAPHVSWTYFGLLEQATAVDEPIDPPRDPSPRDFRGFYGHVKNKVERADKSQNQALLGALAAFGNAFPMDDPKTDATLLSELQRFASIARRYSFTARPN